jgi:hypothetical protein
MESERDLKDLNKYNPLYHRSTDTSIELDVALLSILECSKLITFRPLMLANKGQN